MTPQREDKHVQRAIRKIPINAVTSAVTAWETGDGLWCLVKGELEFVETSGGRSETTWDNPIELALFVRWVQARPERIHPTHGAALAFVRSTLGKR